MSENMTFEMAEEYIEMTAGRGSKMGLEREKKLMELLGRPQDKVNMIHIAGTNGKGSFGAMLSAVLSEAGYRVGGFSSPALTGLTDSFRINGEEISRETFAEVIGDIRPVCESLDDEPTQFEVLTAAAFRLFEQEKCDIALVECGMGGDTDSTNVISAPILSVITNVQLDHCGVLGNTVSEIALHKAGIIKRGCPVFFGGEGEALDVIRKAAEKCGSDLYVPDRSRYAHVGEKCGISQTAVRCGENEYTVSLGGCYQYENAVNVLCCADILRSMGYDIPESALKRGLERVRWHGRCEVLREKPLVVYDGSHNPDGIRYAAETIRRYLGGRVILLTGVMADKAYELYPGMLGSLAECVYTVTPHNPRALRADKLAQVYSQKGIEAHAYEQLGSGVRTAFRRACESGLPMFVLGSLYMYKDVTAQLGEITEIS